MLLVALSLARIVECCSGFHQCKPRNCEHPTNSNASSAPQASAKDLRALPYDDHFEECCYYCVSDSCVGRESSAPSSSPREISGDKGIPKLSAPAKETGQDRTGGAACSYSKEMHIRRAMNDDSHLGVGKSRAPMAFDDVMFSSEGFFWCERRCK